MQDTPGGGQTRTHCPSPSHPSQFYEWYPLARRSQTSEVNDVRNGIRLAIAGLVLLTGCDVDVKKAPEAPAQAQFKAPYHIEFDTKAAKPNPTGLALPAISYTANPKALEKRAA